MISLAKLSLTNHPCYAQCFHEYILALNGLPLTYLNSGSVLEIYYSSPITALIETHLLYVFPESLKLIKKAVTQKPPSIYVINHL